MARYRWLVMANAKVGREEEYREWYEKEHLPDALAVPGFISCELLEHVALDGSWRFANIYEVESDDIDATIAELFARVGTHLMPVSDCIDDDNQFAAIYKQR